MARSARTDRRGPPAHWKFNEKVKAKACFRENSLNFPTLSLKSHFLGVQWEFSPNFSGSGNISLCEFHDFPWKFQAFSYLDSSGLLQRQAATPSCKPATPSDAEM